MDIKSVLLHIADADDDQQAANLVADYKAQSKQILGDLEAQALLNQAIVFEYSNLDSSNLSQGELLEIKARYVKAKGEHSSLKLNKRKVQDLIEYLTELSGGLPTPKNFVDSVLKQLEGEKGNANLQHIRRLPKQS